MSELARGEKKIKDKVRTKSFELSIPKYENKNEIEYKHGSVLVGSVNLEIIIKMIDPRKFL